MSHDSPFGTRSIPVTVDKSHLITIGEKLYTEKTSFIRELVNNAYDADATEVQIDITPTTIVIRDNGSGMSEAGLKQYFTIGSSEKKTVQLSPRFGRTRIGEFGIGKFAALAACRTFEVATQSNLWHAKLTFDKEIWSRHAGWELEIEVLPPTTRGNGTTLTLHHLNTQFIPGKVRRYLIEKAPLAVPNFAVFVNGERVSEELITGRRLPIDLTTSYGPITGTLVITPASSRNALPGIAVAVKNIVIRSEQFGLESSRKLGVTRLAGRVNANWLPITSSRDDFLRDSAEFVVFTQTVTKEIDKALKLIREEGHNKANLQASRVLKDALQRIGKAMKRHRGLFPGAAVPLGTTAPENGTDAPSVVGYEISDSEFIPSQEDLDPDLQARLQTGQAGKPRRGRPQGMLGNKSVIRTLRVANLDIAVRLEHLGDEDESLVSSGVIYINLDHPLYRTYHSNDDLLTIHIARVITKELALQTGIVDASRAFALQAELLTSALKGKGI